MAVKVGWQFHFHILGFLLSVQLSEIIGPLAVKW